MTDDLEDLLRATLAEDAEAYTVSPGSLVKIRERTRKRPVWRPRLALAGAVAVAAAAAVTVVATVTPRHDGRPASIGVTSSAPAPTQLPPTAAAKSKASPTAPALPAAVGAKSVVMLGFDAQRLLLGGNDVWVFGMDSAHRSWVADVYKGRLQFKEMLSSPVCSASVDDTGVIAVVYAGSALFPNGTPDCSQRGTLGLLDVTTLQPAAQKVDQPAAGGDVLVRKGLGIIVANGGVISLLDGTSLGDIENSPAIGGVNSIINLANDPNQQVLFATVLEAGQPTKLVRLDERTLKVKGTTTLTNADGGALPYATDAGQAWVSLVSTKAQTSAAGLVSAAGKQTHTAFPASAYHTNYAESGNAFWSLTDGKELTCAGLTTGVSQASSAIGETGNIAADKNWVYVAVDGKNELDLLTPTSACGGPRQG